MLVLKNVTKKFGDIVAVDGVNFEIGKGEFVFLTGPSGAGKTTILRLILRELKPDTGEIKIDDIDITALPGSDVPSLRQKIGTVFQDYKLLPERTVAENVEVALAVSGVDSNEWKARVDQVLSLVGLVARSELFPAQLSGGELQRVSLARALVINPILILADEPTGNLDWETADSMMQLFEKINKEGKTILMATHNREIIDKMKKRVIDMKDGKIVGSSDKEEKKEEKPKHKISKLASNEVKVKVEES